MKVVSVFNYKGGVGKTTLTANLGAYAASKGKRVLLIDLDPQSNLTFSFMTPEEWHSEIAYNRTMLNFFSDIHAQRPAPGVIPKLSPLIIPCNLGKFEIDIISSHLDLIDIDAKLSSKLIGNDNLSLAVNNVEAMSYLRRALNEIKRHYDLVLIDCPPNFFLIVKNALTASDYYIVPTKLDYFSTLGTEYVIQKVSNHEWEINSYIMELNNSRYTPIDIELLGVVPMMVSPRDEVLPKMQQVFYDRLVEQYHVFQWVRNNNEFFGTETKDKKGNRVPGIVAHMKPDSSKERAKGEIRVLCTEIIHSLGI